MPELVRRLFTSAGFLSLAALMALPARAEPPPAAAKTLSPRVAYVRIDGNFEIARAAADLRARLAEAADRKTGLVVLQLTGNAWRPDVALELAHVVRASPVPIAAWLADDEDQRVGVGQLLVARAAATCCIAPRTRVESATTDIHREPGGTKADRSAVDSALTEELARALRAKGRSDADAAEIARALVFPAARATFITGANGAPAMVHVLTPDDKPDHVIRLVMPDQTDGFKTVISAELGRELMLFDDKVENTRFLAASLGFAEPPTPIVLPSDLQETRAATEALLASCDRELSELDRALDLPDPKKRSVSRDSYRDAARKAAGASTRIESSLTELESIFRDVPELLHTPAPGQTDIAAKPSSYAAKWRSLVQSRKDKLAKLRAKAEEFAKQ